MRSSILAFIVLLILFVLSVTVLWPADSSSPSPVSVAATINPAKQQQQQQQQQQHDDDEQQQRPSPIPFSSRQGKLYDLQSALKRINTKNFQQNHEKYSSSSSSFFHPNFKFHIYNLPRQYIEGAIEHMHKTWHVSICNRGKKKSNYTMLDWRHAHSLFTADVFIARDLRRHPQHTENLDEAEAFIIPMMTHVYNCAGLMRYTTEILSFVYEKHARHKDALDHRDHYLFWWRWGMHFGSVNKFWRRVVRFFPNVNLISFDLLEIMGRNQYQDFSLALKPKFDRNVFNIIVPYPDLSPALNNNNNNNNEDHNRNSERNIFFYFAGTSTIGGIRRWIKWNCDRENKKQNCLYVDFASTVVDTKRLGVPLDYPTAMMNSVFCGHAAGDALSSRRPTSAILAGCIPVLICDLCLYAWESILNYESFAVFVPEAEVIAGNLMKILREISKNSTRIESMRRNLKMVRKYFSYSSEGGGAGGGGALDMLVKEMEMRSHLQRKFRRWFRGNSHLSSDPRDYPVDPPVVMKYVKRTADGAVDKSDTANSIERPWPQRGV